MANYTSQYTGLQIDERLGKAGTAVQPEGLTKAAVGLSNVDNTSDADKPISSATQTALNSKQDTLISGTNIKTVNSQSLLGSGNVSTQTLTIDNKTSAYTVVASDLGKIINCTSGIFTVSLTTAATLGAGFNCWIWNTSTVSTDTITIDPNSNETVDGLGTLILRQGEGLQIVCDGTNWQTGDKKVMRGYAENIQRNITRPVASGSGAIAIGPLYTSASGPSSIAIGGYANASGTGAVAIGYYNNNGGPTASGTNALAFGNNTNATAANTVAIGSNSSNAGAQAISGAGAMALGGSYASGTDSFAAAIANNTSSYGATGKNSVAVGPFTRATSANASCIGGAVNTVTANNATVAGGYNNVASGLRSFVAGGAFNTASGDNSHASGLYAAATHTGKQAFASGQFAASGDAQTGKMVLRRQTTDTAATVLTADNATPSSTNQVILPDDSTYAFTILVVARRTDADNESAGYKFEGVIDRNAASASTALVGTVSKTVLAEDSVAWDCNVSADTTNGGLKIEVTGEAGKTIRWVATAWTTEVTG